MIRLSQLSNFTASEDTKLHQALALVNYALKDEKFKAIFMACKFDNTNDTNAEIWANVNKDGSVSSLDIEMLSWWSNHVYHTIAYEEDNKIVFNRYYFDNESLPALANTIFHEWGHACGYSHASSTDYLSEPYQSGNKLEQFLEAMTAEEFKAYLFSAMSFANTTPVASSPAPTCTVSGTATTS
jgi:hypothetical protein